MTGPRHVAMALALALLLAACGVPVEEEGTPSPEASAPAAEEPGQPGGQENQSSIVWPTPATPAARGTVTPSPDETPTCYQPTPEEPAIEGTPVEPSQRITSPGAAPTPPPYEPLPLHEDAALEARLRDALGPDVDSYGVAVKSLADGSGAVINPDKVFYAASLFKVAVMYEVFHQRALGLLSFDEPLLVTPYYAGFDLGTLPVGVCQTMTIREALGYMMSISDNVSAVLLQDRVGAGNINRSLEALGLTTTRLLSDDLPATASDMALLMEMIARGQAVDAEASQAMVNLLSSEELDNGLRAGVPEGTMVAHKTGNWTNATNDAGIVYLPAGPTGAPGDSYVIAVLSDKEYERKPIAKLSQVVFEYYTGDVGHD